MTRRPPGHRLSPRIWMFLLIPLISLLSLSVGLFAFDRLLHDQSPWPLLLGLGAIVAGSLWLTQVLIRRLEADLNDTARLARNAAELYHAAPCGYVALDEEGRFLSLNDTALAWLGHPPDRLLCRPFRDLVVPAGRAAFDDAFARLAREGSARDLEFDLVRHDGQPLLVLLNAAIARGPGGEFQHARCTFLDVTSRRRSEQHHARIASQLEAVLDAATQLAVFATDLEGHITLFNAGAERMLGHDEAEMIGRECPWGIHLPEELAARAGRRGAGRDFDTLVWQARVGGRGEGDWTYVRKDGGRVEVHTEVTGVRTPDGQLAGYLFLAQDVTERNRAQERLAMTMEAARVGTWDWNIPSGQAVWSDNVPALLGLPPDAKMTYGAVMAALVPVEGDTDRVALEAALADPIPRSLSRRLSRAPARRGAVGGGVRPDPPRRRAGRAADRHRDGHHRAGADRPGSGGGPGRRPEGQRGQEFVPRRRQPRDPHPPGRHHRPRRGPVAHRPRRGPEAAPRHPEPRRRRAARAGQRHPRPVEGGVGEARPGANPVLAPGAGRRGPRGHLAGRRGQAVAPAARVGGGPADDRPRRPGAAASGAAQPALQRGQVHP